MTLGTAFHVLTGEAIHHFLVNVQYLLERPAHGQADERGFRDSQSCRCCGNLVESRIIKGDKFVACKALSPVCRLQSHNKNHSDRKSTRLNSSHLGISYAVFCLKKKK